LGRAAYPPTEEHPYSYAENTPTLFVDVSGLLPAISCMDEGTCGGSSSYIDPDINLWAELDAEGAECLCDRLSRDSAYDGCVSDCLRACQSGEVAVAAIMAAAAYVSTTGSVYKEKQITPGDEWTNHLHSCASQLVDSGRITDQTANAIRDFARSPLAVTKACVLVVGAYCYACTTYCMIDCRDNEWRD